MVLLRQIEMTFMTRTEMVIPRSVLVSPPSGTNLVARFDCIV